MDSCPPFRVKPALVLSAGTPCLKVHLLLSVGGCFNSSLDYDVMVKVTSVILHDEELTNSIFW